MGFVFSRLEQNHTHSTYLFIYLRINSQIIFFVSLQSFNRFLNTLCGNEFYWRLKIRIFLKHAEISLTCHACKMLLDQCSNMNKNDKAKTRFVSYLHIFKPKILFTENKKWLNMRNFAIIKSNSLSFRNISYGFLFCFTLLLP